MEFWESWHDAEVWKLEFSSKRDVCLLTRLEQGEEVPGEIYPLVHSSRGRIIDIVRQVAEDEFIYTTGEPLGGGMLLRQWYHHVRLRDGEIKMLETRFLRDEYKLLYSEIGTKLLAYLLEVNELEEVAPEFRDCSLYREFKYDRKEYEVIFAKAYLIIRDKKGGRIYSYHYLDWTCEGLRQVTKRSFLGLFSKEGKWCLKRLSIINGIPNDSALLYDGIAGDGIVCSKEYLMLENLQCQIEDDLFFTKSGIYNIARDSLVTERDSSFKRVTVRRKGGAGKKKKGSDEVMILSVVCTEMCCSPRVLGLLDWRGSKVFGEVLNLVTLETEPAESWRDLRKIAERSLRELYEKQRRAERSTDADMDGLN